MAAHRAHLRLRLPVLQGGSQFCKYGRAKTKHLRVLGMSVHSDLLFQAARRISNPFVLCTLISGRTRQLMASANGNLGSVQLVQRALNELLAGVLEFEMPTEKEPKREAPNKVLEAEEESRWKE